MNSKLLILLSLVFVGLLLNSYFLSRKSLEGGNENRRFMLRDSEELFTAVIKTCVQRMQLHKCGRDTRNGQQKRIHDPSKAP